MKTSEVIFEALNERIMLMKDQISSAETLLVNRDYLQCAVRLQCAAKEAEFDNLLMSVFDSMSANKEG